MIGISFFALIIVSLIREQYRSIDLLASSFPGIGKSIPVGSEFVSRTAIIGIPSFFVDPTGVSHGDAGQIEKKDIKVDNSSFSKAIFTIIMADVTMSLDNVLSVAGAAKGHFMLLIFGLALSIALMAFAANLIARWIEKYKWIGWLGLIAILVVAIDLIYTDLKLIL